MHKFILVQGRMNCACDTGDSIHRQTQGMLERQHPKTCPLYKYIRGAFAGYSLNVNTTIRICWIFVGHTGHKIQYLLLINNKRKPPNIC